MAVSPKKDDFEEKIKLLSQKNRAYFAVFLDALLELQHQVHEEAEAGNSSLSN
jgi:hypothetical protein